MDLYLRLDRTAPLRAQLERELRAAIRTGQLRAGTRLPPTRTLAEELEVSRGVVVEAYSQLAAEGYLVARPRDGTRVAEAPAQRPPAPRDHALKAQRIRYDLRTGVPDLSTFPRREWQSALARALRDLPDPAFSYGSPGGLGRLRNALSDYLGRVRGVVADPGNMFVCAGAAAGLSSLWHTLKANGARRVAVEDPGWRTVTDTIAQLGLEAVPVAVDDAGLDVAALARLEVDAVVVSPAHQYPIGTVLRPERRVELIGWAQRQGALIVEDDYDAEYRYDRQPLASLQGLAPDCVAYVGTVSKTLAPALRMAWVLVPAHLVDQMTHQHAITRAMPSAMDQAAYASLLELGAIDRHLRRTRRMYGSRRTALIEALARRLPEASVAGAAAGLHLVAWLPDGADETSVKDAAARRGVAVHTLHADCALTAPRPPGLLLGYGLIAEQAIDPAVSELAAAVRS